MVSEESAWKIGLAGVNVRCGGGYITDSLGRELKITEGVEIFF